MEVVTEHLDERVECGPHESIWEHLRNECALPALVPITEIKNKVFRGTIESLTKHTGTIAFQIENRMEVAEFCRYNVLVNKEKLPKCSSLLTVLRVGMPVSLKVYRYTGIKDYNFKAAVVEPEGLLEHVSSHCLDVETSSTESLDVSCKIFHGTVLKLTDTSGIIAFHIHNEEERAIFFRKAVLINKEKISNCTSLTTVLKVGTPVSLMVNRYIGNKNFNFTATLVEEYVLEGHAANENQIVDYVPPTKESLDVDNRVFYGTIESLGDNFGVIAFQINDEEEKAVFYKKSVLVNNEKLSQITSLLTVLKIGIPVSMMVVHYIGLSDCNFRATVVEIVELPIYAVSQSSDIETSPQESYDVRGKMFHGIILRLTDVSGIIEFQINDEDEKAIFFKNTVLVNKERLTNRISLLKELEIGMPVSLMVYRFIGNKNFNFKATLVIVSKVQFRRRSAVIGHPLPLESLDVDDRVFLGTIESLTDKSGVIQFLVNNKEEKAIFFIKNVLFNNVNLAEGTSLLTVLKVGMRVSLVVDDFISLSECNFKARVVKIEESQELPIMIKKTEPFVSENYLDTLVNTLPLNLLNPSIKNCPGKIKTYTSSSTGIVECSIHGINMEAYFTRNFITLNSEENINLQELLPIGEVIYFDGTIKDIQGDPKLRIVHMWHGEKPQISMAQRRKIHHGMLQNEQQYIGTVCDIRPPHEFVASVGNIPVLVSSKHFSESLRYLTRFVALGDSVRMVVQRSYRKKAEFDWVAIDAWRDNSGEFLGPAKLRDKIKCSLTGSLMAEVTTGLEKLLDEVKCLSVGTLVTEGISTPAKLQDEVECNLEGRLVKVEVGGGVLEDSSHGGTVTFLHADAFLFGVSLADMDLTRVFTPGDMLRYSLPTQLQAARVWYGAHKFEDFTQQFGEIVTYCRTRSVDRAVYYTLASRLGNERFESKENVAMCSDNGSDTDDSLYDGFAFGEFRLQTESKSSESRMPNVCKKKVSEPNFVTEDSTASCRHILSALYSGASVVASGDSNSQHTVEAGKQIGYERAHVRSLSALRQQLGQFTCSVLTEGVKETLQCSILSILHQHCNGKIYSKQIAAEILVIIENVIQKCLTEPLLVKVLQSMQVPEDINDTVLSNIQCNETVQGIDPSAVEWTGSVECVQIPKFIIGTVADNIQPRGTVQIIEKATGRKRVAVDEKPTLEYRIGSFWKKMKLSFGRKDIDKTSEQRVSVVKLVQESLERQTSLTEEAIPKILLCVDQGTQTVSTGKVFFIKVITDN